MVRQQTSANHRQQEKLIKLLSNTNSTMQSGSYVRNPSFALSQSLSKQEFIHADNVDRKARPTSTSSMKRPIALDKFIVREDYVDLSNFTPDKDEPVNPALELTAKQVKKDFSKKSASFIRADPPRKTTSKVEKKQIDAFKRSNLSLDFEENNFMLAHKKNSQIQSVVKNAGPNIQINLISEKISPKLHKLMNSFSSTLNQTEIAKKKTMISSFKESPKINGVHNMFSKKNIYQPQSTLGYSSTKNAEAPKFAFRDLNSQSMADPVDVSQQGSPANSPRVIHRFMSSSAIKKFVGGSKKSNV
jgi:hypothetical protein